LKINENNKDKKNVFFLESIEKSELQLTDESENQKLIKDLIYFFNLGSRKKHEHKLKNFEEFKQRLKVKLFYWFANYSIYLTFSYFKRCTRYWE